MLLGLVLLACSACAARPISTARVGSAEESVRVARNAGAARVPDADFHLRLAERQIATARRLLDEGEPERAEWFLVRAEADATVADALAREAHQKAAADAVADHARDVASEGEAR